MEADSEQDQPKDRESSPPLQQPTLQDIYNSMQSFASIATSLEQRLNALEEKTASQKDSQKDSDSIGWQDDLTEEVDFEKILNHYDYAESHRSSKSNNSNRRKTMLELRLGKSTTESSQAQYHAQIPDHSHIRLDRSITVKNVSKFIDDVIAYQTAHGIKLPIPSKISIQNRDLICAQFPSLNEFQFARLDSEQIRILLQRMVRPKSTMQFYQQLEKNVEWKGSPNLHPTPTTFKPFYQALLQLRSDYRKVYEILAYQNEVNIPFCKNKEGGLLKLFLDKIPHKYGFTILQYLRKTEYKDIYTFFKEFYAVVDEHNEIHEKARQMLDFFSGTEYAAKQRAAYNATHPKAELNVMESEDDLYDVYESEVVEEGYNVMKDVDADKTTNDSLAVVHNIPNRTTKQRCITAVLYGKCNKEGCQYDHSPSAVMEQRAQWIELMQTQQKTDRHQQPYTGSANKPKILQRSDTGGHRINVADYLDEPHDEPSNEDSQSLNTLRLDVLASCTNQYANIFFKAVHHDGFVLLKNGAKLKVSAALFDSGALGASYVSEGYLKKHKTQLSPYLVPVNGRVKLAAEDHWVEVTKALDLNVCFTSTDGKCHKATVRFHVLCNGSHDMVIGLPAILEHFGIFFLDMLRSAMTKVAVAKQPSIAYCNSTDLLEDPWKDAIEEEAPEDIETPEPCSFRDVLHYMEISYDEAVQEYMEMIEKQTAPEFIKNTKVVELLRTKGVKVFVPSNWEGIKHLPDLELRFTEDMPTRMKPHARPINPLLFAAAKKEYERLLGYMYRPSQSPIASCLVIAPKATKPFIRFCGDYVTINKYIVCGHYPIPNVLHSLQKISGYSVYLDLDLVNAFHQRKLSQNSSEKLSIQTPWGQVEPMFMPEGISPATGHLQEVVDVIFGDFADWTIAIFDNLLVLAHDYQDAFSKLEKVLDKCLEYNLYLKFSKTWLGFTEVTFFGYHCKQGCYSITEERKEAIYKIPIPTSLKKMQSFLGMSIYLKEFVPHYSTLAAPLTAMTHKDFKWDNLEVVWTKARMKSLEEFKNAMLNSFTIYFPDYTLVWVLRADASRYGVGIALYQVVEKPNTSPVMQPIMFASSKFSPQAMKWDTIEQEAYALYFAVNKCAYFLRAKDFILETDHNNLRWMEASSVPKIIRWRIYLQSFRFKIRHIPGKLNIVADYFSRIHDNVDSILYCNHIEDSPKTTTPKEKLDMVHGGRCGHPGAHRTWLRLNQVFPGHHIPFQTVSEYVRTCAVCQKNRLGMQDALVPIYRPLAPEHQRKMIGIDSVTVTPADKAGNCLIIVIVVIATKLTFLHPAPSYDAQHCVEALFRFYTIYGIFDTLVSDPGSDLTSKVVQELNDWFGVQHRFSLVDRHESNGVERTNATILSGLRAMVHWFFSCASVHRQRRTFSTLVCFTA